MSNQQSFIDTFKNVYTNFRREYFDYIQNYSNDQYFVWCNATLKVASQQVPYWLDANSANSGNDPDGYLPQNLSPYYLRERPVVFYDDNLSPVINKIGFRIAAHGDIIISTVIFIGEYTKVFLQVDTSLMTPVFYGLQADEMADMSTVINGLQTQLNKTIRSLSNFHNFNFNLLTIDRLTAAQRSKLTQNINVIDNVLVTLRNKAEYILKICTTCDSFTLADNNNLVLNNTVEIIGAVSWDKWKAISSDPAYFEKLLTELILFEHMGDTADADTNDVVQTTVNDYYKDDPSLVNEYAKGVAVTSTIKAAQKFPWWIVAVAGGLYILNDNGNGKK